VKLPSGAEVAPAKVRDYLLNPDNSQNRGKSTLFTAFGFRRDDWQELAAALQRHSIDNDIIETSVSPHSTKHVVRCQLMTPDGRNPCLTTVWIIDTGATLARLVTAY
jgi:hypothetical protein